VEFTTPYPIAPLLCSTLQPPDSFEHCSHTGPSTPVENSEEDDNIRAKKKQILFAALPLAQVVAFPTVYHSPSLGRKNSNLKSQFPPLTRRTKKPSQPSIKGLATPKQVGLCPFEKCASFCQSGLPTPFHAANGLSPGHVWCFNRNFRGIQRGALACKRLFLLTTFQGFDARSRCLSSDLAQMGENRADPQSAVWPKDPGRGVGPAHEGASACGQAARIA
jgi:hypothetical protein